MTHIEFENCDGEVVLRLPTGTVPARKPTYEQLVEALSALVPYAESRAEDLSEIAEETRDEKDIDPSAEGRFADDARDRAWDAVETARRLLAEIEVSAP